jgi:methylglutaconyl-CoA hydratase
VRLRCFFAGASFDELLAVSMIRRNEFSLDLHMINAMRRVLKLIVGRIHGKAVGGGVGCVGL